MYIYMYIYVYIYIIYIYIYICIYCCALHPEITLSQQYNDELVVLRRSSRVVVVDGSERACDS